MNARYNPVAVGLVALGIFMLVGFWPLGVVLILAGMAKQAAYRERYLSIHHASRRRAEQRRLERRAAAGREWR